MTTLPFRVCLPVTTKQNNTQGEAPRSYSQSIVQLTLNNSPILSPVWHHLRYELTILSLTSSSYCLMMSEMHIICFIINNVWNAFTILIFDFLILVRLRLSIWGFYDVFVFVTIELGTPNKWCAERTNRTIRIGIGDGKEYRR